MYRPASPQKYIVTIPHAVVALRRHPLPAAASTRSPRPAPPSLPIAASPHRPHPPRALILNVRSMEVFIGTGASLEDLRAAQNQRRALCSASAAAMAATAAAASAGGDVEDVEDDNDDDGGEGEGGGGERRRGRGGGRPHSTLHGRHGRRRRRRSPAARGDLTISKGGRRQRKVVGWAQTGVRCTMMR
jgi:hypothetical protein